MEFLSAPEVVDETPLITPDQYMTIGIVLAVLVVLVVLFSIIRFRRNRAQLQHEWRKEDMVRNNAANSAQQSLTFSPLISFRAKSVFTKQSLQVMEILENIAWDINADFSVLTRIGLDQFLSPEGGPKDAGERATVVKGLKSELLDYLIINGDGLPVLGVVFYNEGPAKSPRQPDDAKIDIMRQLLNKAGIRFFEIPPGFKSRDLQKRLKKTLKNNIT